MGSQWMVLSRELRCSDLGFRGISWPEIEWRLRFQRLSVRTCFLRESCRGVKLTSVFPSWKSVWPRASQNLPSEGLCKQLSRIGCILQHAVPMVSSVLQTLSNHGCWLSPQAGSNGITPLIPIHTPYRFLLPFLQWMTDPCRAVRNSFVVELHTWVLLLGWPPPPSLTPPPVHMYPSWICCPLLQALLWACSHRSISCNWNPHARPARQ